MVKAVVQHLPSIKSDGRFMPSQLFDAEHANHAKGKGKKRDCPPPREVAAQFMEKFYNAPVIRAVQNPETRAVAAMQENSVSSPAPILSKLHAHSRCMHQRLTSDEAWVQPHSTAAAV